MNPVNPVATLDPFQKLPPELFESVLRHFDFREIMKNSLVSKNWASIIGSSNICMKRVSVIAEVLLHLHPDDMISSRCYQNISLTTPSNANMASRLVNIIRDLSQNWKKLKIIETKFESDDFARLMEHIAPTVEDLNLMDVDIFRSSYHGSFHFPALKVFKSSEMPLQVLSTSEFNLTVLDLSSSKVTEIAKQDELAKIVMQILVKCDELETLILSNFKLSSIFTDESIQYMNFTVRRLKVDLIDRPSDFDALNMFLASKSSELQFLSIKGKVNSKLLSTIYSIRNLKMLKISKLRLSQPLNCPVNPSLNHLHLLEKNLPIAHQKVIIENSPKLKFLSIYALSNLNIQMIDTACKDLEWLSVAYVWISDINGNFFSNLTRLDIAGDVQYLLEQEILNKEENQRTNFEKLILNAI